MSKIRRASLRPDRASTIGAFRKALIVFLLITSAQVIGSCALVIGPGMPKRACHFSYWFNVGEVDYVWCNRYPEEDLTLYQMSASGDVDFTFQTTSNARLVGWNRGEFSVDTLIYRIDSQELNLVQLHTAGEDAGHVTEQTFDASELDPPIREMFAKRHRYLYNPSVGCVSGAERNPFTGRFNAFFVDFLRLEEDGLGAIYSVSMDLNDIPDLGDQGLDDDAYCFRDGSRAFTTVRPHYRNGGNDGERNNPTVFEFNFEDNSFSEISMPQLPRHGSVELAQADENLVIHAYGDQHLYLLVPAEWRVLDRLPMQGAHRWLWGAGDLTSFLTEFTDYSRGGERRYYYWQRCETDAFCSQSVGLPDGFRISRALAQEWQGEVRFLAINQNDRIFPLRLDQVTLIDEETRDQETASP